MIIKLVDLVNLEIKLTDFFLFFDWKSNLFALEIISLQVEVEFDLCN